MNTGRWKERANELRTDTYALYLAFRHPRVPWYAKLITALVVGYALSPIDLVPDFIPVLGYLDDVIIIPLGFTLALRFVPDDVLEECRKKAKSELSEKRASRLSAAVIILIWLIVLAAITLFVVQAVT